MSAVRVLTGLDLPWGSPGGSVELLKDLYLDPSGPLTADTFMLTPDGPAPDAPAGRAPALPALLDVPGKQLDGDGFWDYVDRLTVAITTRFAGHEPDVVHLQHLAFGATPALLRGYLGRPAIGLVHGTDLLFAAEHPTQARVLRDAVAAATALVVPTAAMADRLRRLTPVDSGRIVHIPWGVPDTLLARPPARRPRDGGELRVLYAGRLTAEKGAAELAATLHGTPGLRLSMAAPVAEFRRLAAVQDLSGVHHLGWLAREELWAAFAAHDLLVVPSAKLEAFGLVAVEAQACGLPVVYQPVPGLRDALGDSALPLDLLADPRRALAELTRLRDDPAALDELRRSGLRNAARFPLSATARALAALSAQVR
ncbi:glycosyltransferase family 4 protein [Streptomyces sp. JB150]|uniref:glycosyltransferase family 4 protein n=1 Tax=Streptomyces sp. JB150 TaxID=2714844 RepID=UPI00140974F4|nr:glycosyltransferase family 4 protein [Streptomyces sp. JB150]QIJ66067.1 glycosyltransferase family 4 protein [Streptomyces sp. JB150]